MRVWDCDPAVLCTKHLNAQHREIHWAIRCIEGGWRTRWKDVERFRSHPKGIQWLGAIHDMTVIELQRRGRYSTHKTLVEIEPDYEAIVWLWKTGGVWEWIGAMESFGYPRTELNQGTPWERDNVSFDWYRGQRDTWTRAKAEAEGAKELNDDR